MGAAVCSCQRQGHPLGDFRPRHCHFGYHGDGVNEHMHRKVVANHRISVLEVCGSNHYMEAMVAAPLSLFLLSSLFFSSALIFLLCLFAIPNPYLTARLVCHIFHASFTSKQRKQVKNFFLTDSLPSNSFSMLIRPQPHYMAPSNMASFIFNLSCSSTISSEAL